MGFEDGSTMGTSVLLFPILMGVGRAVYESINKGIFLDFYPSPELHAGVFGNVMMFGTLSSSIVFLLDSWRQQDLVLYLLIGSAICTCPMLILAKQIQEKPQTALEPLLTRSP